MTTPPPHPNPTPSSTPGAFGPPTKHQLALMIWLAVFPTLLVLNLALGDWLRTLTPGPAHLRARDHRGADRHLRPDAAAAPGPQTPADPERQLGRKGTVRNDFQLATTPTARKKRPRAHEARGPSSLENIDVTPLTNGLKPTAAGARLGGRRHGHHHLQMFPAPAGLYEAIDSDVSLRFFGVQGC